MALNQIEIKSRCRLSLTALIICCAALHAQTSQVPEWQTGAGGKMQFDVASVRLDKGEFRPPTFALSSDDWFRDPHGRFFADFTVETYIEFAYKDWLTDEERRAMLAGLPSWVNDDRYAIEATAPLNATKDQYRLMMQALLADRFQLKLHVEQRDMPVLAMTLVKPGKTGPKLIPHGQGLPCDAKPGPDTYPPFCYGFMARPKGQGVIFGSRDAPMALIGKFLGSTAGGTGEISRPVVDQTGLTGRWDFTLEAAVQFGHKNDPGADPNPGPTVMEAMQDQLGLRFKPTKAVIPILVIDHIERPSEN